MAIASPEHYACLASAELAAASATDDPTEKKRRLNQASAFATLAELARFASTAIGSAASQEVRDDVRRDHRPVPVDTAYAPTR